MKFRYDCVNPKNLDELNYITDNMTNITYRTFRKYVDNKDFKKLKEQLGYKKDSEIKFTNDWSITYHKSTNLKGDKVYLFCHSGIEYIFY
jgi:hypothetical protein